MFSFYAFHSKNKTLSSLLHSKTNTNGSISLKRGMFQDVFQRFYCEQIMNEYILFKDMLLTEIYQ